MKGKSFILKAKGEVKKIYNILSCLFMKDEKSAKVRINKQGIKFVVTDRTFEAYTFLRKEFFYDYRFEMNQNIDFSLDFHMLLEFLMVDTKDTSTPSFQFSYPGPDECEYGGVSTEIEMGINNEDEFTRFLKFDEKKIINKVVLKSEVLKEMLAEPVAQMGSFLLHLWDEEPHLCVTSMMDMGGMKCCLPKTSEAFELFDCPQKRQNYYNLKYIKIVLKALKNASTSQVQIGENDMLRIRSTYLLENETIIQFIINSNTETDEDEDEDEDEIMEKVEEKKGYDSDSQDLDNEFLLEEF